MLSKQMHFIKIAASDTHARTGDLANVESDTEAAVKATTAGLLTV